MRKNSHAIDSDKIRQGVRMILEGIGEDPAREGLAETPDRIAKMYGELFSAVGCEDDPVMSKVFSAPNDSMVAERGITFYSMCEHHMLPFFGQASIAYVPDGEVIGLSKLVRIVDFYSKKLQLQERLTDEIADAVSCKVKNKGVFVVLSAEHLCVSMRGASKPSSATVTMACRGVFMTDKNFRDEAMALFKAALR